MNFTRAELMAIVFSRALRNGDVIVMGTNATIPSAAWHTARGCGKAHVRALIGATGTVCPSVQGVPKSGADQAFIPGRATLDLATGVMDQLRGFADVIFLGALQVDVLGRCNLTAVGDYAHPRLRGPGSIGLSMVATVKRTFMFFERHDPRLFVEQVDFVSGETIKHGEDDALLIVTPLAVMGACGGRVELKSVHPGVRFDEVQACTGFHLDAVQARETPAPSLTELAALRSCEDGKRLGQLLPA